MPAQVTNNNPPTVTTYEYNGTQYKTKDEADQARRQHILSQYADAESVGFDEARYNRLIQSGYGLSQMSDSERNYISKKFLSSADASTKYTGSVTDQYLSSVGLPPASALDKYRTAYSKYAAGGGIEQNYGNLSADQWKKINELWAKDWEYGLTDTDYARKAAGLAPSSYDDMYEDTLLDDELKAAGLPPSKLLNGKLGDTYNEWVKNAQTQAALYDDFTRTYLEHVNKSESERAADKVADKVKGLPEYTMEQAWAETLAKPQWSEFVSSHAHGSLQDLPYQDDDAYIVKGDNGYALLDDNGQNVYDRSKWEDDVNKINAKNAKITGDEFAINLESAQEYYNANASMTRADMDAQAYFEMKGIKYDYDTRGRNKAYVDMMSEFFVAKELNEGQGYTIDLLFPEANLSDKDRESLQPYIVELNRRLYEEGFTASQEYLTGEFSAALHKMSNDDIVSYYRKLGDSATPTGGVSKYADMSDAEILHQHYDSIGKPLGMSDEQIKQLEDGTLTVSQYMQSVVKTPDDASAFAVDQYTRYLEHLKLPTTTDALNDLYEKRAKTDALIASYDAGDRELYYMSDEEFNKLRAQYANYSSMDGNFAVNMQEHDRYEDAAKVREEIRKTDPEFYTSNISSDSLKQLIDNRENAIVGNYADAVSYTEDFANRTKDMDYVNKRFEQICEKYTNTAEDSSDLYARATDDEKRKLVYLADTEVPGKATKKTVMPDTISGGLTVGEIEYDTLGNIANTYLNKVLLQKWNAEQRAYNREAQGGADGREWWGEDSESGFVRWLGGFNSWLAAIPAGIGEGVWNLGADTIKVLGGYEILSSHRSTWAQDVTGNIAGHIEESHPGFGGEVGSFVVQSIPSMVKSATSAWLAVQTGGASEAITLALMATEAYSGAVDTALQQGASSKEAYLFGLANGLNEFLFEKISLDSIVEKLDIGDLSGKALAGAILANMPSQGFVEGTEEVNTSLANLLAENLILGYNSSYKQTVQHYLDAGLSENEAMSLAKKEIAKGVAMDFIGGFVSGAIMVVGGDLIEVSRTRHAILDRTGVTDFLKQTHNLSTVSVEDALTYARAKLTLDTNGKYTIESARDVFTELVNRGADSATLSRVNVELLNETNTTQGVNAAVTKIINEQHNADAKKLLSAASKYVYSDANKRRGVKSNVTQNEVDTVVKTYLNELSNVVQTRDIREIEKAANDMRNGFISEIADLATYESIAIGTNTIDGYFRSLSEQAQAAIVQNAEKYKNTFNGKFKGDVAGRYANMAATIEYAVGNGEALTGLNTVFGESATVASTAVENICLNSNGEVATRFVDGVLKGIATLQQQSDSHLFKTAQNGVDTVSYVATQMALAQSMQENSLSRSMCDYIIKYGASSEAMDLLTAANIYDTMGETEKSIRKSTATFHTAQELSDITGRYNKAAQNYNDKLKIMEAHQAADAQALESENARIAGQEETVRVLDAQFQETQGSDKGVIDALGKARNALNGYVAARDNLTAEQNKRMVQTQADVDGAKEAYEKARAFYQMTLKEQSVRYIEHFGSQLEGIKNRDHVSHIELARMNAYATYAAAENLNEIETRMIDNEKTSAVALGSALGVEVECVSFSDAFFESKNVPAAKRNKSARGVLIGGKVYLNTDVMTANVGSLTNEVLAHEIGHILEVNTDNYEKYSAFAIRYFENQENGKENVELWVKALTENEEHPMTKEDAYKELVAEFTRKVALADPRAVSALCKSAPNMSMRIFQWLTNTRNRMDTVAASQSKIVRDAQRAFAKGMRVIRETNALKTAQNQYENAPSKAAMDNAIKALEDRARLEAERQRTAQAQENAQQAETQTAQAPQTVEQQTQTEQTEAAEAQQTVSETVETPTEENVEETVETPAVEEQTVEEVEEEPQPTQKAENAEPVEDFADVVIEEDNGYLGYDVPTGSVNIGIKGETLAEGEYYYDEQGNAYDESGNLVQAAQTDMRVQTLSNESTPEDVFEAAKQDQKALDNTMRDVAAEIGIGYSNGVQKSVKSMREKLARKGSGYSILDMKDHARTHLELTNWDQIKDVFSALSRRGIQYSAEAIPQTELGYRGLHLTWKNADGTTNEIQLSSPAAWKVKLQSDLIYEKWRNVDLTQIDESTKAEYDDDVSRSREMWDSLQLPDFTSFLSSSSESTRAFMSSSPYSGDTALTQAPSTSSFTGNEDASITRPDSVMQTTNNTSYESDTTNISENSEDVNSEAKSSSLLFQLTSETRDKIMRVVTGLRTQNADADGKVPQRINDQIVKIVKFQVTHDANYVDTPADVLDAYAERFKAPEQETTQVASNDSVREYQQRLMQDNGQRRATRATGSSERTSTAFSEIQQDYSPRAQYYTEYDPQAAAVRNNIEKMTEVEKKRTGDPQLIRTSNGYMVARKMSKEGFMLGDPMYNSNRRNIAMIAPVSEFPNGDVGKTVAAGQCKAVVIPNTRQYAELRADARDAGTLVYNYDESDPTQFDRAINRAANSANVEYMPEMRYEDFVSRYGAIPQGANPRVENRSVPQQTTNTNRVSRMARTAAEAPMTTDQTYGNMQSWITRNGTGTYTPVSNARSLGRARAVIERAGSVTQAAEDLHRDVANDNGKNTDLLARAELLYAEAQNPYNGLSDLQREQIFGDMCIIASDSGRALQLASQLKHMTAEGHIAYIEQVGKRMADRYQKRTGKRTTLKPTEEEIDRYKKAITEEERNEIDKDVGKRFADETSELTFLDRVRNWRYFSMLGNPRTHFRNMVGNALMNPIARTKDAINAGYQSLFGIDKAERTTSAWTGRVSDEVKAFVEEQFKENLPRMQGVSTKYIEEAMKLEDNSDGGLRSLWKDVASAAVTKGRTKLGRGLNKLSSFNSNALEFEDAKALGWRFRSAMYQIIKARGLDVNTMTDQQKSDIVNYAMEESLRATFRDASALADALNRFANTNKATRFAMEAIVPFRKTPINIAKRSVEYSPLGVINGVYKMVSNNVQYKNEIARIDGMKNLSESERNAMKQDVERTFKTQKIQAIDRLASGTTGSILTAIGVFAASMGWISIGRKDDEGSQFETALGKNNYSLNIGDVSIDLSAFSPAAVPLLMGTALYQSLGSDRDENLVSSIISTLAETVDPITEMSMLSGIADALSGVGNSQYSDGKNTRWFGTIAGNAVESMVSQFVPTFVGQVARVTDPYARSYSAGDDYWASKAFGSEVGSSVKSIQNKIPGLSWLSEPKVDLHGEPVKNYTNWGSYLIHPLNNFVLPATIKVDQKNEIDDELIRLYGEVDSSDIFPTKPSRNIGTYTDKKTGEKVTLKLDSDAEYMEYQKEVGQTTYDMLEDLMQSMEYRRMTDDQKAEAIAKVIDQAKSATKKRWKAQMIADRK